MQHTPIKTKNPTFRVEFFIYQIGEVDGRAELIIAKRKTLAHQSARPPLSPQYSCDSTWYGLSAHEHLAPVPAARRGGLPDDRRRIAGLEAGGRALLDVPDDLVVRALVQNHEVHLAVTVGVGGYRLRTAEAPAAAD